MLLPNTMPRQTKVTATIQTSGGTTGWGSALTIVDRSTAVLNSVTVFSIGIYSTNAITYTGKILLRNSAGNYDIVVSQSMAHAGGGWQDFVLTSTYRVPSSGNYFLGAYQPNATTDFTASAGRSFASGDVTGTGQTFTENTGAAIPLRYTYWT